MLNRLKDYNVPLERLLTFVKGKNVNIEVFIKLPTPMMIWYIISYLSYEGYNISINGFSGDRYEIVSENYIKSINNCTQTIVTQNESLILAIEEIIVSIFKKIQNHQI